MLINFRDLIIKQYSGLKGLNLFIFFIIFVDVERRIDDAAYNLVQELRSNRDFDAVIVALSGGADSVTLLFSLHNALSRIEAGPRMIAAHCNFHLRGEESDRDEKFVRDLCLRLDVPLHVKEFDTIAFCREHHYSIEEGARELRHGWFKELCSEYNALLATGHNSDDNAETLLLNLLRGSGSRGLRGMLPAGGGIFRPLLSFSRGDILNYLEARGEEYITDSSNLSNDYRRNYLRNDILPRLRERWPGADRGIAATIRNIREENAIVEQALAEVLPAGTTSLPIGIIRKFAAPRLLIFRFISPYGGTVSLAEEMLRSVEGNFRNGAVWNLPAKQNCRRYIVKARKWALHILPVSQE